MGNANHELSVDFGEARVLAIVNDPVPRSSEQLLPLLYDELRRVARWQMRLERSDHTLQATALVHEAYFRLGNSQEVKWESRAHFLAAAAEAMR